MATATLRPAAAQAAAGAQLWRMAAATVPLPPALALGGAATFWTPAQPLGPGAAVVGLDLIQGAAELGAAGFVAAARARVPHLGMVGIVYGRMQVSELVRTETSPDPVAGAIPYHASSLALAWAEHVGATTLGATLRMLATKLDAATDRRWTVDGGVRHRRGPLHLGLATHFLSTPRGDAAQDIYAGAAYRVWRGEAWSGSREATLEIRYGITLGRGDGVDHLFGMGIDVGATVSLDAMVAREDGDGPSDWRPVGGLGLSVGRYRVTLAGELGAGHIPPSFRVGFETSLR